MQQKRITDENGDDVPKGSVLVVRPYDEFFGHTEKTSTLLVDAKLRTEYEQLHVDIDKAKAALLKALKDQSGSRKDLEEELSSTFTKSEDEFYVALNRVRDEVWVRPTLRSPTSSTTRSLTTRCWSCSGRRTSRPPSRTT